MAEKSLRFKESNDDLPSIHLTSGRTTRTDSFSSGYELTPSDSPPNGFSPRMSQRTLQLSDNDEWKIVPKHKSSKRKMKLNLHSPAAKIQAVMMKGNGPEFKFKMVVGLLLAFIVIIVVSTSYFHKKQHILIAIRDRIFFFKDVRQFNLLDSKGHDLLSASFGLNIPLDILPIRCHTDIKDEICLDWKFRAKLLIKYEQYMDNINCYNVKWESYNTNSPLKDCFDLRGAHWYGMGQVYNLTWPINDLSIKFSPFVTSHQLSADRPFGSVIGRYWISSRNVAIKGSFEDPLFVSFNHNQDRKLCLESKINVSPFYSQFMDPTLNYKICTGPDITRLHTHMLEETANFSNESVSNMAQYFERTIWATDSKVTPNFTQDALKSYADRIMDDGFEAGFILLDFRWEAFIGQLELDTRSFDNPHTLFNILHNRGFKILMMVTPYIEINSQEMLLALAENRLVQNIELNIPYLTRCGNNLEKLCALIDFEMKDNREWFKNRLRELKKNMKIDGFVFANGQSSFSPNEMFNQQVSINPDNYLKFYKEITQNITSTVGLSAAAEISKFDGFIYAMQTNSSWKELSTIIPTILSVGLIGYPLFNIGSVGGSMDMNNFDNELYLRWLQLSSFLPIIQMNQIPDDPNILQQFKDLIKLRETKIVPVLKKAAIEYQTSFTPIIRPIWWLQNNDNSKDAFTIDDQFAIGNEIIVAPIVKPNQNERDIYLPSGWWRDEIHSQELRGGKWMRKYQVPSNKVAYFTRIEQSTA